MARESFKPVVVGVTTLSSLAPGMFGPIGTHVRHKTRLALELRLDLGRDWRKVLDSAQWAAERLEFLQYRPPRATNLKPFPTRVIATCRRPKDGGQFDGTERQRRRVLEAFAELADYIDIESGAYADVPTNKIIRSHHDLDGVPDFAKRAAELRKQPHGILKIVGRANCLADNLVVRDFLRAATGHVAAHLMGRFGVPSRLLAHAWGSKLSYHMIAGQPVAEGMVSLAQFVQRYRGHRAGPRTRVFGVTGERLEYSQSPRIHNEWLSARNENAMYLPLPARDFADFQAFATGLPIVGASVTIPFKEAAFKAADEADAAADRAGACNTLLVKRGRLEGLNTDTAGFMADLRRRLDVPVGGLAVLILGTGGAARAVASGLQRAGASLHWWSRKAEAARAMAKASGGAAWRPGEDVKFGLLVNATPCGMTGSRAAPIALPWRALQPVLASGALGYDLVYSPVRTPLLLAAEQAGFGVANGWEMLLRQAALQAKLFGYRPPRKPLRHVRHIWLIGPRASGKSKLAAVLARKLGCEPTDTDRIAEGILRLSLQQIFQQQGEAVFRAIEAGAVQSIITQAIAPGNIEKLRQVPPADELYDLDESASPLTVTRKVVATGGGIVENPENVMLMRMRGTVVYLDTPVELLVERLKRDPGGRPSLTGKPVHEEVHEVLRRRRPLYEAAAHITIRADRSPELLAGEILDRLAQFES